MMIDRSRITARMLALGAGLMLTACQTGGGGTAQVETAAAGPIDPAGPAAHATDGRQVYPHIGSAAMARRLVEAGKRAFQSENYDAALASYSQAEKLAGPSVDTLNGRAQIWFRQKRTDKSLPLFQQARAKLRDGTDPVLVGAIYTGLGADLMRVGDYAQALEILTHAVGVLDRAGYVAQATRLRKYLQNIREKAASAPAMPPAGTAHETPEVKKLFRQGWAAEKQEEHAVAREFYRRALRINPYSALTATRYGYLLASGAEHGRAREVLHMAVYLARRDGNIPLQASALAALGRANETAADFARAADQYGMAVALYTEAEEKAAVRYWQKHLDRVAEKRDAEKPHSPGREALQASGVRPSDRLMTEVLLAVDLGTKSARARDYPRAIRHFRDAVQMVPEHAMSHYMLGVALNDQGDIAGAVDALETAASYAIRQLDRKTEAMAFGLLSDLYLGQDRLQRAAASADFAISIQENGEPTRELGRNYFRLARAYHRGGVPDKARDALQKAVPVLQQLGDQRMLVSVRSMLAAVLFELGDQAAAAPLFQQVLRHAELPLHRQEAFGAHLMLGIIELQGGQRAAACRHLRLGDGVVLRYGPLPGLADLFAEVETHAQCG
mgnify:CR=1 FL=1